MGESPDLEENEVQVVDGVLERGVDEVHDAEEGGTTCGKQASRSCRPPDLGLPLGLVWY